MKELLVIVKGGLAEWSKAPALGAGPKGRGFESLSHHNFYFFATL